MSRQRDEVKVGYPALVGSKIRIALGVLDWEHASVVSVNGWPRTFLQFAALVAVG